MGKYDYNNIDFSMSVSNIKSSLYDVISTINGNIFGLEEDLKDTKDAQKEALKNSLEIELKKLISLSEQVEKHISTVDRILVGTDYEVKEEVEINPEDHDDNSVDLDNKQIVPDQIREDEEVELSEKAINDLYKTEEETSPVEKPIIEIPVSDNEATTPVVAETPVEQEESAPAEQETKPEVAEESVSVEGTGLKLPGIESSPIELKEETSVEQEEPTEEPVTEPETESEEKPKLESLPVEDSEEKPNDNSNVQYMVSKTSNDPSKAIIVTSAQFDKLLASHDKQRSLCKHRKLFKLDNVQHDDMNLEEMMNKANELYKSGDVKGAEALYNKISEINESRNS